MEIYVADQTMLFLQSMLLGAVLGVFYDVFRITRIAIKTPSVVIFAEDLVFFFVSAVISFCFMLSINDGQVRAFILLGELLGFTLYYFTVGMLVMKLSRVIIRLIYRFFHLLFFIFIRPFILLGKAICRWVGKPLKKFASYSKKKTNTLKIRLKQRVVLLYNHNKLTNLKAGKKYLKMKTRSKKRKRHERKKKDSQKKFNR